MRAAIARALELMSAIKTKKMVSIIGMAQTDLTILDMSPLNESIYWLNKPANCRWFLSFEICTSFYVISLVLVSVRFLIAPILHITNVFANIRGLR